MPVKTRKSRTKQCPYCDETIQAGAVKCRYCHEFLSVRHTRIPDTEDDYEYETEEDQEYEDQEQSDILFWARPSLWAISGTFVRCLIVFALGILLARYVPDDWLMSIKALSEQQASTVFRYIQSAGIGLMILAGLILALKILTLKSISYEISSDRIEYSRGIFEREIDNLDMFRVIDLKLHRSLLDCVVGVGSVMLMTKDETDPEFVFEKVRHPRRLYDIVKKASLAADRKQGVIHIE